MVLTENNISNDIEAKRNIHTTKILSS